MGNDPKRLSMLLLLAFLPGCGNTLEVQPKVLDFGARLIEVDPPLTLTAQWQNTTFSNLSIKIPPPAGDNFFTASPDKSFSFFEVRRRDMSPVISYTFQPTEQGTFSAVVKPECETIGETDMVQIDRLDLRGSAIYQYKAPDIAEFIVHAPESRRGAGDRPVVFETVLKKTPARPHILEFGFISPHPVTFTGQLRKKNQGFRIPTTFTVQPSTSLANPEMTRVELNFTPPGPGKFADAAFFSAEVGSAKLQFIIVLKGYGMSQTRHDLIKKEQAYRKRVQDLDDKKRQLAKDEVELKKAEQNLKARNLQIEEEEKALEIERKKLKEARAELGLE